MKFLSKHKLSAVLIIVAIVLAAGAIVYSLQGSQHKPTAHERQCADEARLTSEKSPACALTPTQ